MSSTPGDFAVVAAEAAHRIIHADRAECVRIVTRTYLAHDEGRSINPSSYFLRFPDKPSSRIIALPAHLGAPWNVSGIKWIASFPDNVASGLARASAVLILNSHDTGYPYACLESSVISAARTAASAMVAAAAVRPHRVIDTLGIVGNGLIARYVYDFFVGTGWEIGSIRLFDTAAGESERFGDHVCNPSRHARIDVDTDVESLISASDTIVFTTVAAAPHIADMSLLDHAPLVLHLSLRDLAPEIVLQSNNLVDDVDHVMNANTSVHLAEQRTGERRFINGTIADAVRGRCELDPGRPTIVSPFGLGVLDLAVGQWVYSVARETGAAISIPNFHDTRR